MYFESLELANFQSQKKFEIYSVPCSCFMDWLSVYFTIHGVCRVGEPVLSLLRLLLPPSFCTPFGLSSFEPFFRIAYGIGSWLQVL